MKAGPLRSSRDVQPIEGTSEASGTNRRIDTIRPTNPNSRNSGQDLHDPNSGCPVQPEEGSRHMRWSRGLCRDLISAYYKVTKGETNMTL